MANSLSFNGTNLGTYGLIVNNVNLSDFQQRAVSQLIQDISYAFQPKHPPKSIECQVSVEGSTRAVLDGYLDSIKALIVTDTAHEVILDCLPARYWLARLETLSGRYRGPRLWQGMLVFVADDPMAYDMSETSSDFNINSDPDTVEEITGGNGYILPVYTLTAGEALTDITLLVENLTTDEELTWEGSLGNGEVLTIDVEHWIVYNEGVADMDTVSGKFPRLAPGVTNQIKVTDFSDSGTLNITYRNRYL
jgi:phage-related protein